MARDKTAINQQLADTEQALVTLRSTYRVAQHLMQRWTISERTAMRWMAKVRAKWKAEATLENRDDRRNDVRATLNTILTAAMTRTEMVKDKSGDLVFALERVPQLGADGRPTGEVFERRKLDRNGHPTPLTRPRPDLQRALHAVNQLRHLDALDAPFTAKLILENAIDSMPDMTALDAEQYEKLRDLIKSVAPNGDLRQLAGELYRDPSASDAALN